MNSNEKDLEITQLQQRIKELENSNQDFNSLNESDENIEAVIDVIMNNFSWFADDTSLRQISSPEDNEFLIYSFEADTGGGGILIDVNDLAVETLRNNDDCDILYTSDDDTLTFEGVLIIEAMDLCIFKDNYSMPQLRHYVSSYPNDREISLLLWELDNYDMSQELLLNIFEQNRTGVKRVKK